MTWLKKDDDYPNHRKVRRLSDSAYRLHDTAMHYVAHDETDGLIHPEDLDDMQHGKRLRRFIPELVDARLWDVVPDGWLIHDYLDYNPSHEQLEAERAANRERQARARARRRGTADNGVSNAVTDGVTNGGVTRESQDPVPNRTDPYRTDPISSDSPPARHSRETNPKSSSDVTREPADVLDLDAHRKGGA